MSDFDPHPTSTGETLSHHEKPTMRARPFVIGILCFFPFMALIYFIVWHLAGAWTHGGQAFRAPPSPASARAAWNSQPPQLQIDPTIGLQKLREMEYQRLHTVQWTDDSHTYATIPIEDAMRLLGDAAAKNQLNTVLPAPQPATPLELQNQKSREAAPGVPQP